MAVKKDWFTAITASKLEDPAAQKAVAAIKENLEVLAGVRGTDDLNTLLTRGDMLDADYLASLAGDPTSIVNVEPDPIPYGPTPPPPTNLHLILYEDDSIASPWFHHLEWDNPEDLTIVSHIEVWSSTVDNVSFATRVGIVTPPNNSIMIHGIYQSVDYYYWVRSISYGGKHSTWEPSPDQGGYVVPGQGNVGDLIDTILAALAGEDPPLWDASITYSIGDTVSYDDGTRIRKFKATAENTNEIPWVDGVVNTTYWERFGILMIGEVAGEDVVGIDGNLVVDNTILARHVAADQVEGYHILAGEIQVVHIGDTDELLNANQEWTDIQNVPTDIVQTFYQNTAPTSGMVEGDWWVDSDDNKTYVYLSSVWTEAQDSDISAALSAAGDAQATADGKIVTFIQASAPTAEGVGDLWIDNDDNNTPYRWSGSAWVEHGFDVATWSKVSGTGVPADNADVTADQFYLSPGQIDTASDRSLNGLNVYGHLISKAVPTHAVAPSGAGLYLGFDYMGYYDGGNWKTFMDNAGRFYLGGYSGLLQWDGAALTIGNNASIGTVPAGNIAGWAYVTDTTKIQGGTIQTRTISANKIAVGTLTATEIGAEEITVEEIWNLARINGNRLNIKDSGTSYVNTGAYGAGRFRHTHSLGRKVAITFDSPGVSGSLISIICTRNETTWFEGYAYYKSSGASLENGGPVNWTYI